MSLGTDVDKILSDELGKLVTDIRHNMQGAGYVVSGRTSQSLSYTVGNYQGVLEGASYFSTLETGRPPARSGGGSTKQQFIENLKEWIVAKGISYKDEADLQRLANFFRWYINKFGNKLYRSGGRKDIYTPAIEQFEERLPESLAPLFITEIINNL